MSTEDIAAQGPLDRGVRGVWKVHSAHVILALASAFGAVLAWGWFGPFAGTLWSMACFSFGAMFGMMIERDTPNAELTGVPPTDHTKEQ